MKIQHKKEIAEVMSRHLSETIFSDTIENLRKVSKMETLTEGDISEIMNKHTDNISINVLSFLKVCDSALLDSGGFATGYEVMRTYLESIVYSINAINVGWEDYPDEF